MKRKSIYELVFLAFTATACGAPEMTGTDAKETPAFQLTSAVPSLEAADTTPPQSTAFVEAKADSNGVYHSDVAVRLEATDDSSGVQTIYWTLSGAVTGSGQKDGVLAYAPLINREGTTTITYYAKDNAGNVEAARTVTITMSRTTQVCVDVLLNDYNVFVSGNYTGGHDVRGKVAAAGNIDLEHFSLGADLAPDQTDDVLVAGGALNIRHGGVFGDAHYGESTTANGTVTFYRGALSEGLSFDPFQRAAEVAELSTIIGSMKVNGTTQFQSWGGLYLQGTNTKVNVFEITTNQLSSTRYFSLTVPSGSIAVVNVIGTEATIANFSNSYSGADATGVLFNFPNAVYLNAFNYGFFGTVLAPQAYFDFNNGSFDGGIYAGSLSGNAEGHLAPLRPFGACVDGVGT
ncbi:choice-of-anchor A family protein [Hyalangium versicolor]|uniref:choice-of-anchor A family protein n=1 Tax=Hyalangium versicolor TaxID=2861190 RepID=UPI001CCDFFFB|nr:choice-of-anchor A family protein [Hyalangium versicolor]